MLVVLYIVVAGGVIYGLTRIGLRLLDNHKELKMLREERAARLETAKTAEHVVHELLLDKEMACEVQERLEEGLRREHLSSKADD